VAARAFWHRLTECLVILAITLALIETVSFGVLLHGGYLPQRAQPGTLQVFGDALVTDRDVLSLKKKFSQRWATSEFDVEIRTNASGYRENFEFKHSDVEVAFMGDSTVFGYGVEADERLSSVFAAKLDGVVDRQRVVSLSYKDGFQPEHYEYYLKKNPDIRPKFIVVSLALGNDLESDVRETNFDRRNLSLELPYRRSEDGVLLNNTPFRIPYFETLIKTSYFFRLSAILINRSIYRERLFKLDGVLPNSPNSESLELGALNSYSERAFQALMEIRDLAATWNGRVVIFIIAQNFYSGALAYPQINPQLVDKIPEILRTGGLRAAVRERCKLLHLECVDPTEMLVPDDSFTRDGHWNRAGHRKIGEMLARYFLQNGYF
jgi:hypothetical protein